MTFPKSSGFPIDRADAPNTIAETKSLALGRSHRMGSWPMLEHALRGFAAACDQLGVTSVPDRTRMALAMSDARTPTQHWFNDTARHARICGPMGAAGATDREGTLDGGRAECERPRSNAWTGSRSRSKHESNEKRNLSTKGSYEEASLLMEAWIDQWRATVTDERPSAGDIQSPRGRYSKRFE